MTATVFERPTFALWRETHKGFAARDPKDYAQKENTRRSYVWIVLSEIKYHPELVERCQSTWPYGKHGQETASGTIRRHWVERQRHLFLVTASSRRRHENYIVVFSMEGRFITVYCPTRCDVLPTEYPISVRDGIKLLRLSEETGPDTPRLITEDVLRAAVAGKTLLNQMKALKRLTSRTLNRAELLGLAVDEDHRYHFSLSHEDLVAEIIALNPLIEKEYRSQTTSRTVPPEVGAS